MKCKFCKKQARIKLKSYNLRLCENCFRDFFKKRVRLTIEKFKMYASGDKILIAASGGKDSLCLWHVLDDIGYKTQGLHVDLGISGYSGKSKEYALKFAKDNNFDLKIVNIKEELGEGVRELSRISRRVPCRVCGMLRRYIMNREAEGFSSLATGHTLDDEASTLLGNLLNWQECFLRRQHPVLKANASLKKKIKPFCLVSEEEISFYASICNIEYISGGCPLSKEATSLFYKHILSEIEERMPAAKLKFYKQFIKKRYFKGEIEEKLKPCEVCGYLTVSGVCSFCRLKEKLAETTFAKSRSH